MKISKRKDGRWRTTVKLPDGSYKSVYGKTRAECKDKATELEVQILTQEYVPKNTVTLQAWFNKWLDTFTINLKPTTINNYKITVNNHIFPFFGKNKRIQNITTLDVQSFVNYLSQQDLSSRTIYNAYYKLKKLLDCAKKSGLIAKSPCEFIELPVIKDDPNNNVLDLEQAKNLIELAYEYDERIRPRSYVHYADILHFLLLTGLRISELCGLTFDDYNKETGTLTIHRQLLMRSGIHFQSTKNDVVRELYLTKQAQEIIENRINEERLKETTETNYKNHNHFIFCNGIKPKLSYTAFHSWLKKVGRFAGIENLKPHTLRHSHATISLALGMDIKTIQENLGHTSVSTTMTVYTHSTGDMKRMATKKLEEFFET